MSKVKFGAIGVSLIIGLACSDGKSKVFPHAEGIKCLKKSVPPVLSEDKAICFAANIEGLITALKQAEQEAHYAGWMVAVEHQAGQARWLLQIRSAGNIMPAYLCRVSFTESGDLLYYDSQPFRCGYQK